MSTNNLYLNNNGHPRFPATINPEYSALCSLWLHFLTGYQIGPPSLQKFLPLWFKTLPLCKSQSPLLKIPPLHINHPFSLRPWPRCRKLPIFSKSVRFCTPSLLMPLPLQFRTLPLHWCSSSGRKPSAFSLWEVKDHFWTWLMCFVSLACFNKVLTDVCLHQRC